MAGASYHTTVECTLRHFIRPVLFAFFEHGLADLKEFVDKNLGICIWNKGVDKYVEWLTVAPGNHIPNHLKLYWWILMFWNRLPQEMDVTQ